MQAETGTKNRHIAWNGVCLDIPCAWDARVSGQRQLIFEKDFEPQLQIRWEKVEKVSPSALRGRLQQFASQMGPLVEEDDFPLELQPIQDTFDLVACFQKEREKIAGGIFLCPDGHTLLLFQLLAHDPTLLKEVNSCLTTLSFPSQRESLWCIQDFSLAVPVSFTLKDYTFAAGLTRLSFTSSNVFLQTCKLGPADRRLEQQSLVEILSTLSGAEDLDILTESDNACSGYRNPTIPGQILFRLRRQKPFIRAKIWHDAGKDRLLAVVLSSNRPIPVATIDNICSRYEIVQKENRP
jgi:hypothetical protein